jgi:hypothetical protein
VRKGKKRALSFSAVRKRQGSENGKTIAAVFIRKLLRNNG